MGIFELVLDSRDEALTGRMLADGLGLTRAEDGAYQLGSLLVQVRRVDATAPAGPAELIMRVPDPDELTGRLTDEGHQAVDGLVDIHGIKLRPAAERSAAPVRLSGNVLDVDHIGVASDNSVGQTDALIRVLGFEQESRQIDTQLEQPLEIFSSDTYGVVSHAGPPRPAGALLVTFLRRAGVDLELLEDIMTEHETPTGGAGSTTGDNRAISRYVQRRGPGLHHLAVRVADITEGLARLRDAGIPLIDERGRPGSRRGLIAFADRRGTGGVVLHLVQRP
ncbi:VOC family protein [Pseudonocardia spinosispora]|uniref:VOC family protein n=1 Tax=Pseudonocardia spinosispora TaxID=103441 RepID=UPI0004151E99|nr:VOC family protein [Pseudonocardia spinosispora]